MPRSISRLASALVAVSLLVPTGAAAQTTVADLRAPAKVSAYGGVVAWSSYSALSRTFHLFVRRGAGPAVELPLAGRRVPFDVDVGRRTGGGAVLAYSRCTREPSYRFGAAEGLLPNWSTGRGCDLYVYDLEDGGETRLRGPSAPDASEFMPSVDGDRIVFARVFERRRGVAGHRPGLFLARLGGGRSERLPGGPGGDYVRDRRGRIEPGTAGAGPSAVDLRGRRAAVLWQWREARGPCHRSAVLVDLVREGGRSRQSTFERAAECGESGEGEHLVSASVDRGDVIWGRRRTIFDVPPAETVDLLQARARPDTRRRSVASPGRIVSVVRSRGTGFALTAPDSAGGRTGDDPVPACSGSGTELDTHPPDCRITELPGLLPR